MITLEPKSGEKIKDVRISDDTLSVDLFDGRTVTVPLAWYPSLLHASEKERTNWTISGAGFCIHWPDLDEDLSSIGILHGAKAPVRKSSAA